MKNCLIVFGVLVGCFVIAVILVYTMNFGPGRSYAGNSDNLPVGQWRNYDNPAMKEELAVTVMPKEIFIQMPPGSAVKVYSQKGEWRAHAFYCDSHTDSPAEVAIAHELRNEDLEINLGYFSPSLPDKVTCVKVTRGAYEYHPLPIYVPGQTVSYPPPKGLIRPGTLECDLQTLSWRADRIESTPVVIKVRIDTLSDGKQNKNALDDSNDNQTVQSSVYVYHSERADLPQLLVTVYHGRVVQVVGGAEETGDVPYTAAAPPSQDSPASPSATAGWAQWLFGLFFGK